MYDLITPEIIVVFPNGPSEPSEKWEVIEKDITGTRVQLQDYTTKTGITLRVGDNVIWGEPSKSKKEPHTITSLFAEFQHNYSFTKERKPNAVFAEVTSNQTSVVLLHDIKKAVRVPFVIDLTSDVVLTDMKLRKLKMSAPKPTINVNAGVANTQEETEPIEA